MASWPMTTPEGVLMQNSGGERRIPFEPQRVMRSDGEPGSGRDRMVKLTYSNPL